MMKMVGLVFFFLLAALCSTSTAAALTGTHCDTCYRHSKAAFFGISSPSTLSSGACGYGADTLRYYGPHVAAAAPSIYDNGVYCGACYEVRCMNKEVCNKKGTQVVVTDLHNAKDNTTDLVLSQRAFRAMASTGMDPKLVGLGIVNIEYKRIPCEYKNQNVSLRVEKYSHRNHLAITVLSQGGQTKILIMEIAKASEPSNWYSMSRDYGAVWYTKKVPAGPLIMRLRVMQGFDAKTVYAYKALPAQWKPGTIYSTDLRINDVDVSSCSPCEGSRLD